MTCPCSCFALVVVLDVGLFVAPVVGLVLVATILVVFVVLLVVFDVVLESPEHSENNSVPNS